MKISRFEEMANELYQNSQKQISDNEKLIEEIRKLGGNPEILGMPESWLSVKAKRILRIALSRI